MKAFFILTLISFNTLHAQETKSYDSILSDHAQPDHPYRMRKIQSLYEPSIQRCFKNPLSNYNVTFRQREQQWKFKESLVCYKEENEKLPQDKRVNFDECKEDLKRNEAYDLAHCYQELFVKAHNYHGY